MHQFKVCVGNAAKHGGIDVILLCRLARIHIERLTHLVAFLLHRPVLVERVGTTGVDIAGLYAAHHQVHAGEVVGVLLQFLCIVLHTVLVGDVPPHGFADGDQQRAGTRCGVVDLYLPLLPVVLCHYLRQEDGYFMGGIELTCLLAGIGSKIANEVFIDVAQHIVVLRTVGRDVLDELDEVFQRTCLAGRILSEFAQTRLQGLEDAVIDRLVVGAHQAVEGVECHREVGHGKAAVGQQPRGEEVFVFNEVADVVPAIVDDDL